MKTKFPFLQIAVLLFLPVTSIAMISLQRVQAQALTAVPSKIMTGTQTVIPSPTTTLTQIATPFLTATTSVNDRINELESQIIEFKTQKTPVKDGWDILSVISNFLVGIAGVMITGVGAYATHIYNKRKQEETKALEDSKLALTKAEVIKEHLPTLLSRKSKDAELTLIALAAIDLKMAQRLAVQIKNKNAIEALNKIAEESS